MHHFGEDGKPRFSDGKVLTCSAPNVLAARLGAVVPKAAEASYGDNIDRGLALIRLLSEAGFEVREKQ